MERGVPVRTDSVPVLYTSRRLVDPEPKSHRRGIECCSPLATIAHSLRGGQCQSERSQWFLLFCSPSVLAAITEKFKSCQSQMCPSPRKKRSLGSQQ